jgi:ribosomal protein S6--L-glutamate ligase
MGDARRGRWAILTGDVGWHVRDLQRAARDLGHEPRVIDFRWVHAGVATSGPPLGDLSDVEAVIVRTMPTGSLEQVVFRMDVLHQLQERGVRVVNPPRAVEVCVDKYLATARLAAAGLPVPPTIACQGSDRALEAFEALGGDVVVKPLFGSEGRGMVRISDPETAWRTFRALARMQSVVYVQSYIAHPGWDLRAFILGGRPLAAMRRQARGDWRTNVAQGGRAEPVALGSAEAELATRAAAALGAEVAGVDLLPRPGGGWYVLEINAVPGWRALARVTGVDVAAAVWREIEAGSS